MRLTKGLGVFILLLGICVSAGWSQQNRLEELEKTISNQQQQIQELETLIEQREKNGQSGQAPAPQQAQREYAEDVVDSYLRQPDAQENAGPKIGYDDGFFVAGDDIVLKLKGFIMWQAVITEANTIQDNSVILRRNRLDAHVYFYQDWHARICIGFDQNNDPNFDGDSVRIREGYIEYTGISCLKVLVGVTKLPFSMEFYGDETDMLAIAYSPFVTVDSVPRRDAGIVVYGDGLPFLQGDFFEDYFSYSFGVYNGDAGTNDTDGQLTTNADDDVLFVASARFFPFDQHVQGNENIFLHASVYFNDTDVREDGARIRLDGLRNHEVYGTDLGGVAADVDDTNGDQFGIDLGYRYWDGNLRIEGEFMYVRLDRDRDLITTPTPVFATDIEPLEMWGASTAISYFFSFDESAMGIEPLFKFSYTTIEDDESDGITGVANPPLGTVDDIRGQDIWEVVFGARFHYNDNLRFDFNWVMYDLKETRGLSNNDRLSGGGMLHSFLFQVMARW